MTETLETKTTKAGADKRRHERYPVGIALEIQVQGRSARKCRGAISELSQNGMTFESDAVLELGDSLYLKLDLPLEIRGEIRHIRPGAGMRRYGVRFHHVAK